VKLREENQLIIESVRIAATTAECEQLRRALVAWAGPTSVESGCISCRILQESDDPQAFCYLAHWNAQEDPAKFNAALLGFLAEAKPA
jgi:quinol monooxygenase YgiN